ncbi:hypothetical protein HNR46_000623 [Haloferula luteola]|uniref:DNA recombination and repair protein Rad51-like C-terminal domain-containing protein n=1 Tax=Haloferula luteola TaxID=595692 RepID=A0A840V9D7_9BACT|nr:hypothetical protein [Haloferula luteola]MBB5350399.1 hypothetical protein [Haloferula luteola]
MAHAIEDLRKQLREKFPQAHAFISDQKEGDEGSSASQRQAFSAELFPMGAISEVMGPGLGMLVAGLLGEVEERVDFPEFVLVDGGDGFDPASFTVAACSRLLWVRCQAVREMFQAAELLVRDGNVPFVLLDTCGMEEREWRGVSDSVWWRLKWVAEKTGCRLVVMSLRPRVPCAVVRWLLNARWELVDFEVPRRELIERMQVVQERERRWG